MTAAGGRVVWLLYSVCFGKDSTFVISSGTWVLKLHSTILSFGPKVAIFDLL